MRRRNGESVSCAGARANQQEQRGRERRTRKARQWPTRGTDPGNITHHHHRECPLSLLAVKSTRARSGTLLWSLAAYHRTRTTSETEAWECVTCQACLTGLDLRDQTLRCSSDIRVRRRLSDCPLDRCAQRVEALDQGVTGGCCVRRVLVRRLLAAIWTLKETFFCRANFCAHLVRAVRG